MPLYRIVHSTKYRFEHEVAACRAEARLTARAFPGQEIRFQQLVVRPMAQDRRETEDDFGNPVTRLEVEGPLQTFEVTAINLVATRQTPRPEADDTPAWKKVAQSLAGDAYPEVSPFRQVSPLVPQFDGLADYAAPSFPDGRAILAGAEDLMRRIYRDFSYDSRATTVATSVSEVLVRRRGVCQDFAQLAIGCLRSLGLAARYVSGYLDSQTSSSGARRIGGQASHAWLGVFVPEAGWVDLDPTNDRRVDQGYVTLAWGRDYGDVAPLTGHAEGGGRHSLSVDVDVAREDARSSICA